MKRISFLSVFIMFAHCIIAQTIQNKNGSYLNKRIGQGVIEEERIHKLDFADCKMKNVAVLYWADGKISRYNSGNTLFDNKKAEDSIDREFNVFADSIIKQRFEQIKRYKFTVIGTNPKLQMNTFFQKRKRFKPFSATVEGKIFLRSLKSEGYDGLLLLFEDESPDCFKNLSTLIPSKGLYKKNNQCYVYHSVYSRIFDLDEGETIKNMGFLQMSADFPSQKLDLRFFSIDIIKNLNVLEDMKLRFENNIDETIKVLKLNYVESVTE